MKIRQLWQRTVGPYRVRLTEFHGEPKAPEYPIARTTWARALRLREKFGSQQALEVIDARAWKAFQREDYATSRRWRDLIIAIHAIEEDELLPGERIQ